MAELDFAIYVDNDGSGNLAPVVYVNPATLPAGGTRLPIDFFTNASLNGTPKTISGATNATPIVITSTAHGFSNDDVVLIEDVGGNTAANGTFVVASVAANTFELRNSAGNAAYTSGGTAKKLARTKDLKMALAMAEAVVINYKAAGN